MKNFKIFERLKRLYREKRPKAKFKLGTLLTTLTLVTTTVTGCSIPKKSDKENDTFSSVVYSDDYITDEFITDYYENTEPSENYNVDLLLEDTVSLMNTFVNIDSSDLVKETINNTKTEYVYSDIYDVISAYQKYEDMEIYHGTVNYDLMTDNKFDVDKLYNEVKINNRNYMSANPYCLYEDLDEESLKRFCNIIVNTLNKELENNAFETTLDDLTNNLLDLKIFKSLTMDNAFITDDNVLGVSLIAIENMEFVANNEQADDIVIAHETEHLLQKLCNKTIKEQGIDYAYGYNVKFNDLPVNSLFHEWLVEAAAENLACALYGSEPTTYTYKIGYLNTLSFTRVLNADFNIYDLERLTQQQELDKVFEMFECKTYDEKIEFLNMMCAINIIQQEPEDFMTLYEKNVLKHTANTSDLEYLKIGLKNGVCTTMTKYFYTSLANKLQRDGLMLDDVFSLISIFEAGLSGHIEYAGYGNYGSRKQFIQNYVAIQDSLFELIGQEIGMDAAIVEKAYQNYNAAVEIKYSSFISEAVYNDIIIGGLTDEKNNFVTNYFKKTIDKKNISIDEIESKQNTTK